jgi:excinuclease ABC subunit C
MTHHSLKNKAKSLPNTSGVYMMMDDSGRVMYIGKANCLRARVGSYFRASADVHPRCEELLDHVSDIDFVTTPSEVDALMLEARLIKELQPKYNVSLKDGKSYPFLAISQDDNFPRVFVTRERKLPGHRYFGPFPHANDLHAAVELLQQIFRFRNCALKLGNNPKKKAARRPCLRYSLRLCCGPCAGRISKQNYAANIAALKMILRGKHAELVGRLRENMLKMSRRQDYEMAAALRDQIRAIKRLSERGIPSDAMPTVPLVAAPAEALLDLKGFLALEIQPARIEGIDLSTIRGDDLVGAVVTFLDGLPQKDGYRRYKLSGEDDLAMLREVVHRRYRRINEENARPSDLMVVDGGRLHLAVAIQELLSFPVRPAYVAALAKYDGAHLYFLSKKLSALNSLQDWQESVMGVPFAARPAFSLLCYVRDEAHRFANAYHRVRRRKRELGA